MKHMDLFGLILTGGRSTRMGSDKSLITYHGKPQREFLYQLLAQYCENVFTSCRSDQEIPPSLNPLYDDAEFDLVGPMKGILSAFKTHPDKAWLIVAVDMPYVDEAVIQFIIKNRSTRHVATCFYNEKENFPEPLITLWEPQAFPLLKTFVGQGRFSPRDFLKSHDVNLLTPEDPKILTNINSLEEIEQFKRRS